MTQESVALFFRQGSSAKEYNAELTKSQAGWNVNFSYGRIGSSLVAGTKTKTPVPYDVAKKTYDKLVKSKAAKGYQPGNSLGTNINVITNKVDSGIYPQLLNEMTEIEAHFLINDDNYCMQEKFDGARRLIKKLVSDDHAIGINKKGIIVPLASNIQQASDSLGGQFILDGEDMGETIMCFDDLSNPHLTYRERYTGLLPLKGMDELVVVKTAWTTVGKQNMFDRLKRERAEGVVFKRIDAPYNPGRPASGGDQFKCKFYETASCIVTSVSDVKSSIAIKVYDDSDPISLVGVPVGNATVYPNSPQVKVGDIVEVKYLYYYEGGSLYQPVLLGLRDDVDPDECTLAKLKRKKDD